MSCFARSLLVTVILPLAGCPLLAIEAEVGEVCVTYKDIEIEGVPTGDRVQHSFSTDDLGQLKELADQDAELAFTRVVVRAHGSGVPSVSSAHVTVASGDPESALPTMPIVECDGDCVSDGYTIDIPAGIQQSALEYVQAGSLVVDLDLRGQLPIEAWTADVDVCMTGKFSYVLDPSE
jgi:hypothetical protein